MLISERIYKLLDEKGISQKEFVSRTGISQSTVSDWRRKGTNPSADKILVICDVLDVSPYELLAGTEDKKGKSVDYLIVDKSSKEFELVEWYRMAKVEDKRRIEGYFKALKDLKQDER